LENRFKKQGNAPKSSNWNELSNENDLEEILLRNTFLNSKIKGIEEEECEKIKKDFGKDLKIKNS
jgi:hypothetical protein